MAAEGENTSSLHPSCRSANPALGHRDSHGRIIGQHAYVLQHIDAAVMVDYAEPEGFRRAGGLSNIRTAAAQQADKFVSPLRKARHESTGGHFGCRQFRNALGLVKFFVSGMDSQFETRQVAHGVFQPVAQGSRQDPLVGNAVT